MTQPAPPDTPFHCFPKAFWTVPLDAAFSELRSQPSGLSSVAAAERLKREGPNLVNARARRSLWSKALRRVLEPLTAILLLSAAISGMAGDWQSFIIIVLIVALSIGLDIYQENEAEAAIDALKKSVAVTATVLRDGHPLELPVKDLVRGDVVRLRAGDLVPADGFVIASHGAMANEASLTGEPYPSEKSTGPCSSSLLAEARNAFFAGTSLIAGDASMLVAETGAATTFGAIAASVEAKEPMTAFESGVHGLGMLILRLTVFLVLFVLLTQLARHGLSLESFMFAVALAVGLTPELLPMIMTVTLARGALRMAKRKVVVKRLSAIHDLGAMDVLCTDKTGTLTEAKIALVETLDCEGQASENVARLIRLNSQFASGARSNLDDAVIAATAPAEANWSLVADMPFDFERRRSSVLVSRSGEGQIVSKGAPEAILDRCTHVDLGDKGVTHLDAERKAAITSIFESKGKEGLRLLGVARRTMPLDRREIGIGDESDMTFVGVASFLDPPKSSATAAVAKLIDAGVAVKIISGDAAAVVSNLVQILHLPSTGMLTGDDVDRLSDAALADQVASVDLFVRVSPDQKGRIVRALRTRGYTVGFLGDGINDATAIHAADVGLSVEGGTDVARDAADIILLQSDLNVLADGVAEGRRTYANIMKYVRMGTSSNFGNMLSMALASLILPFLPLMPLQILINNLLYDLSEIGIPFDSADAKSLAKPHAWNIGSVLGFTLIMGPLSSLFDITTFVMLSTVFKADVEVFRTAWFVESIATQILVIFVIRTALPFWTSRPSPILAATSLGALFGAVVLALTPLGRPLGFVPIPASILAAIAGITLTYLLVAEAVKPFATRWSPKGLHNPLHFRNSGALWGYLGLK
ncbi:magnesium-translocating P-type ATPase [Hyphomicrobium sp.]|uniref:magnesium-translocating P-type ATPase n=1 Tax=Hyphomicrobium sp. TaxID=82 RepID=UPI000FADD635|nr:magnesium-translocating P-type ATPase [Hyphomicrobium sp.]RUP00439.1 MAG: magnesium-translocating P-type ATPase [Hyphomicrobium sp.]